MIDQSSLAAVAPPMTRDGPEAFEGDIKDALDPFKRDLIRCWIEALTLHAFVIIGVFALALHCGR
jgi:hypothetical protein